MEKDITFCELRRREVINGSDGSRLGHIIDAVFSAGDGSIKGIILPYGKRGIFAKAQDLFVPWSCVQKIGEDVILVEIIESPTGIPACVKSEPQKPLPPAKKRREPDCDGKCEKCMLFDCTHRWSYT